MSWMQVWSDYLRAMFAPGTPGGKSKEEILAEEIEKCLDKYEQDGTLPYEMTEHLEFKLMVYNRERYATEDDDEN